MNLVENLFLTAAEEAAELAQKFTKASRFGLESTNPKTERKAAEDIVWEFNDLLAVIELLKDRGIQFAGIGDPVVDLSHQRGYRHQARQGNGPTQGDQDR
jgi:hypothetical protein